MNGIITLKTGSGFVHHAWMPLGIRDAIEAKIISEIPFPIPRWVISSPNHMSRVVPAVSAMTIRNTLAKVRVPTTLAPAWLWNDWNRNT